MNIKVSCRIPLNIAVLFYFIDNVELSIFHCTFRILKHNEKALLDFDWALTNRITEVHGA